MDAFQTYIVIIVELFLLPFLITAVSLGSSGFIPRSREHSPEPRTLHLLSLAVGLGLFLFAIHVLLAAPHFDFIDRCRPSGTTLCVDGRTYDEVRQELRRDKIIAIMLYLIVAILLPTVGVQVVRRLLSDKKKASRNRNSGPIRDN